MRRWLVRVFAAVSVMIVLAFVAPLAVLIKTTAEDRAIDAARADALAVVPALVIEGTRAQIEAAVGATSSGRDGHMTVVLGTGQTIGVAVESLRFEQALENGSSAIGDVVDGMEVVVAVSDGSGQLSAVRVFIPAADLRRGLWAAWSALGVVAALLTGISVVIADRLARTVVSPTVELARAAERLGSGDLEARVEPSGPPELVGLGASFNQLGDRFGQMLSHERELLAELSHRLRTPLTPLRMKIERVNDASLAADLRADVDELTRVVNSLIEEARRGAGRTIGITRCDAASVVADRVDFWSVLADDQQRAWRFDRSASVALVSVDESELGAAVDVLLENAFAHTQDDVGLDVSVKIVGREVLIVVGDAGVGFDSELVREGASGAGSTGLGLHIARRCAERAGGRMEVGRSELGGAQVALIFPLLSPG